MTASKSVGLRQLRKRNMPLGQENEVLHRATAYVSRASVPGEYATG